MTDIAARAGVSQSTVSRVLSGSSTMVPITADTRERIVRAARELNYRPNPLARALRGSKTMLLGAVVRDIADPFFADAIDTLSVMARRRGYALVLGSARAMGDEALELTQILEARHCDGILILGDMRDRSEIMAGIQEDAIPLVTLWYGASVRDVPSVDVDNAAGIAGVVEHLASLGHRRIAFVGAGPLGDIRHRAAGFETALAASAISPRPDYIVEASNDPAAAGLALDRLIGLQDPPTAIVAATDLLAVGLLHAANRRGLVVPRDLSVTGFDDIRLAAFTVPALTTVRMPIAEMIEDALRLLLDDAGPQTPHRVAVPSLVLRSSTGPPRAASA